MSRHAENWMYSPPWHTISPHPTSKPAQATYFLGRANLFAISKAILCVKVRLCQRVRNGLTKRSLTVRGRFFGGRCQRRTSLIKASFKATSCGDPVCVWWDVAMTTWYYALLWLQCDAMYCMRFAKSNAPIQNDVFLYHINSPIDNIM